MALAALAVAGCGAPRESPSPAAIAGWPWARVEAEAQGTTVVWRMWRGDPSINAYVDRWLAPRLRDRHGIRLVAIDGQGPEVVNQLLVERQAGARGSADLVWINGSTFHDLRQADLLFGPWAERLPHAGLVDTAAPEIALDFGQDPAGYESPWGRVQFALIYDAERTPDPPRSVAELGAWIHAHPGRFTHDQSFTGVAFLEVLLFALNGGHQPFTAPFDEARYRAGSARVWEWLHAHRGSFWRGGEAYPPGVADLHRLFANGEVDFSMSYNENEVVTKARQGILPPTARPLLLADGTPANAHYVGIPFNAPNPAGAMVVANLLLSPEAQLEKADPDVWADGTVLAVERLPPPWPERFTALAADARLLPRDSLRAYARPEVAPEVQERLAEEWRTRIRAAR